MRFFFLCVRTSDKKLQVCAFYFGKSCRKKIRAAALRIGEPPKQREASGCKPSSVREADAKSALRGIHLSEACASPLRGATHPMSMDEQPDIIRCLAPSRVFHARSITRGGGGLLPRLFTLARRRFVFCGTVHTRRFALRIPTFQSGLCSAVPGLSSKDLRLQRMPAACQMLKKNFV